MLLPPPERRAEIHFYVAKSLPYSSRYALAFALLGAGLVLQVALPVEQLWAGFLAVFAGVLLLLVKGYENTVVEKPGHSEWRPARHDEVQRILDINAKQKAWDRDLVDITSGRGFLVLVATAVLVVLTAVTIAPVSLRAAVMLVGDAILILLPFWITGTRSILKNDRLVVRAQMFLKVEGAFSRAQPGNGEVFQYQIQTADARDGSGAVPHDLKALVMFHEGPPSFLGLQMQIAINSVQGTDYPYFYCVLVAKNEFGSFDGRLGMAPDKVVVEAKQEDDVHIAVNPATDHKELRLPYERRRRHRHLRLRASRNPEAYRARVTLQRLMG